MSAAESGGVASTIETRGFATRQLLSPSEVSDLRDDYARLDVDAHHGFFASNVHASRRTAFEVDRRLRSVIAPRLREVLPGFEPFLAAFISKGARHGDRVEYHQDWTYTDERRARAIVVWIPLVDVSPSNGAIELVPGSHRWTEGIRPFTTVQPTAGHHDALDRRAVPVPLPSGSALFYDPALVHGSGPNVTEAVRPVAAVALAPAGEPLVHFRLEEEGLVGYQIDESFFTAVDFGRPPRSCPDNPPWTRPVASSDIGRALGPTSTR